MMNTQRTPRSDDLHAIIDEKLTALVVEMEEADWSAEEIASAIEDAGFSPTVRGETLDIPGFAAVCAVLLKL